MKAIWCKLRNDCRTKLKQTEVDCEYLKTCCETLTEENQRLQKELQELRALKTFQPSYMQLPPTTLTMCPSCERVVTTTPPNTTAVPKQPTSGCPWSCHNKLNIVMHSFNYLFFKWSILAWGNMAKLKIKK